MVFARLLIPDIIIIHLQSRYQDSSPSSYCVCEIMMLLMSLFFSELFVNMGTAAKPQMRCQLKVKWNESVLNIISNFVTNEIKRIKPRDPLWVDSKFKSKSNRKLIRTFCEECQNDIEMAKTNCLDHLSDKSVDSLTPQKLFWKITNKDMRNCKSSRIPPLSIHKNFIINCNKKAKLFNIHFSNQCKLICNQSTLPVFRYKTHNRIRKIPVAILIKPEKTHMNLI